MKTDIFSTTRRAIIRCGLKLTGAGNAVKQFAKSINNDEVKAKPIHLNMTPEHLADYLKTYKKLPE